jgi:ketosteroid isomerase-like protein
MRRLGMLLAVFLLGTASSDEATLRQMLDAFLAGASRNDPAVHARFWGDDLVYTSSAGKRMGKADILRDVQEPAATDAPPVIYTAEDVQVRLYGKTAVVAFRLVTAAQQYLNTGTFVKRGGAWQAVAWQATKIPAAE